MVCFNSVTTDVYEICLPEGLCPVIGILLSYLKSSKSSIKSKKSLLSTWKISFISLDAYQMSYM